MLARLQLELVQAAPPPPAIRIVERPPRRRPAPLPPWGSDAVH